MLEQLLSEIRSGGTIEARSLANRLGVTPGLVEMMLEHLQRAGYIQPYPACAEACAGACAGACGGCGLSKDCSRSLPENTLGGVRLFVLTEPDPARPAGE